MSANKRAIKKNAKGISFLAVSGLGVGIFFVYALLYCILIAVKAGITQPRQFRALLGSAAFQTALFNTCIWMLVFSASVILLALVIVYLLDDTPRTLYLLTVLSVAAVIPSVTITSVFNSFPAFVADHPRLALFFLYLWKYTGICALILKAAAARGAVCGALILFVFAPIVFILVRSLENPVRTVITDLPGLIDNYISFAQYETVLFHHRAFWTAWWNTLILAVPVLLLSAAVAALAAYGAATLKPRPQRMVYGVYVLFSMLPLQMLLVPNYIVLHGMGLIGTRLSVVLIAVFSPYYLIFLYRSVCQIRMETVEAARIEGAGELRIFLSIVLPQIKLGLSTFFLICGMELWSMIEQPLVFLQDETRYPLSILFREIEPSLQYAGAALYAVPMILLYLCTAKDLTRGISSFMGGQK